MVAGNVVPEEAYALHEGEQSHGIRQVLALNGRQELAGRLHISLGESLEDLLVESHMTHVGIVLGGLVGSRAQEVAIVGEDETRHHGVEVDDTENVSLTVEHHVVHLRITVADALR